MSKTGRPKTAATEANIQSLLELIEENAHLTNAKIKAQTSFNPPLKKEIAQSENN